MSPNNLGGTDIPERVVFEGEIGEVIQREISPGKVLERYRRSPGVRMAIVSPERNLLMTWEFRDDTQSWDLRLPGGKVCDTLAELKRLPQDDESMLAAAEQASIDESLQETGMIVSNPNLVTKVNGGSSVEWDLYYFTTTEYQPHPDGQQLEDGEQIRTVWMSATEIRKAISRGEMLEYRTIGALLAHILPPLEAPGWEFQSR